jgi:polysaccharide pyruvyl transferase WcaK-like protein
VTEPKRVCANFTSFWRKLTQYELDFLSYISKQDFAFVEQNEKSYSAEFVPNGINKNLEEYFKKNSRVFFDVQEWLGFMKAFDFSIGNRFHGNVAAMNAGIPALMVTCDSRTTELSEFFRLPHISAKDFNKNYMISYYAESADYTEFKKQYPQKLQNYVEFCGKNGLKLNSIH